jgi:hypothetical protein
MHPASYLVDFLLWTVLLGLKQQRDVADYCLQYNAKFKIRGTRTACCFIKHSNSVTLLYFRLVLCTPWVFFRPKIDPTRSRITITVLKLLTNCTVLFTLACYFPTTYTFTSTAQCRLRIWYETQECYLVSALRSVSRKGH